MSREDKMQRGEAGSGSLAGRIFAFVGVTLAVLILAALAAVFIITKGPSPAARAEFVKRTEDSGLSFVTKLLVPGDEIEAILSGNEAEQTPSMPVKQRTRLSSCFLENAPARARKRSLDGES